MPEYMTKSEPVDKKPYIVYTDEKGILYSGDPDSDIPGGGDSTHKVYLINSDDPTTLLDGISVVDWDAQSVNVYEAQIEGPGDALITVKCFDSVDGTQYRIEKTLTPHITAANCQTYADNKQIYAVFDAGIFYYTGVNADVLMLITL